MIRKTKVIAVSVPNDIYDQIENIRDTKSRSEIYTEALHNYIKKLNRIKNKKGSK